MYKAIKDRIIVRLDKPEAGVLQKIGTQNFRNIGTIVGIGEDVKEVHEGDRIVFRVFHEIALPEEDLVAIREKSVLGVLTD